MILAIDVHYSVNGSTAAGVGFANWESSTPLQTYVSSLSSVVEYIPGQFYQRELPCILNLLREHALNPRLILVDGYVFLDGKSRPGLGKYLFDALGEQVPIVGIAKTAFSGIDQEFQVVRGNSIRPLFVTCVGVELAFAKTCVQKMQGSYRIPSMLKAADQLCRHKSIV